MSTDRKPTLEELFPLPAGIKVHTRRFGARPVSAPVPVPDAGFRFEWADAEQGLRVLVTEGGDGRLAAEATCRDAALRGHAAVSVAIASARSDDSIRQTVPLNDPAPGGGCRGAADFGLRVDAVARLGDRFVFVVFLLTERAERVPPVTPPPRDVATTPPRARRGWRTAAVAAGLATAAAIAALVVVQLNNRQVVHVLPKGPGGVSPGMAQIVPNDLVNATPAARLNLKDLPARNSANGETVTLRRGDVVPFTADAAGRSEHRWLLHIAGSAKLVASAGPAKKLEYDFRQLDPGWYGGGTHYELLVIVAAGEALPGWPAEVKVPEEPKGLFTEDELAELTRIPDEERNTQKRDDELKRVLRAALDRRFAGNRCWFEVNIYQREKRN